MSTPTAALEAAADVTTLHLGHDQAEHKRVELNGLEVQLPGDHGLGDTRLPVFDQIKTHGFRQFLPRNLGSSGEVDPAQYLQR